MDEFIGNLLGMTLGFTIVFGGLSLYGWITDVPHGDSMSIAITSGVVSLLLFFVVFLWADED